MTNATTEIEWWNKMLKDYGIEMPADVLRRFAGGIVEHIMPPSRRPGYRPKPKAAA